VRERGKFGAKIGENRFWCVFPYKFEPEHLLSPTTSEAQWEANRRLIANVLARFASSDPYYVGRAAG